jgi:membrane protein implicated in regulation of membrane protease activity
MFILWCWALAGLKDVLIYTSVGVVIGLCISVFILPYSAFAFASPALLGAGFAAALVAGIFIGRHLRPRRRPPARGRVYPVSAPEVGLIIEAAMKSVGEKR